MLLVKNGQDGNRGLQLEKVRSPYLTRGDRSREVSTDSDLTGRNLIFWKSGGFAEVVACERRSHMVLRLY